MTAAISEALRVAGQLGREVLPWASVAGAGFAALRLAREVASSREALSAKVAVLDQRVADDHAAAQLRGGVVAVELQAVRGALENLRADLSEVREGHAALEAGHDGLAGRVTKVERDCAARHPLVPADGAGRRERA